MSAEPMSELNSDVMDEERSGIICRTMNAAESPIVPGIKEERKLLPAHLFEQAGVPIERKGLFCLLALESIGFVPAENVDLAVTEDFACFLLRLYI